MDAAAAATPAAATPPPSSPARTAAAASPFASRPGAVGSPPSHYGNPLGEQRALAEGRAVVDLSDRTVLTLTGEDRLTWLDSLTSQSVAKLQPGESAETLMLDPSGRVEHAMRVIDDGHTTYLLLDAASPTSPGATGDPDALQTFLSRMVFTLRVEVGRAELRTLGVFAPAEGGSAAAAGGELPASAEAAAGAELPASTDAAAGGALALAVPAAAPHGVPLVWRDPWGSGVAVGGWQYAVTGEHPASTWSYREVLVEPDADLSALPAAGTLALEALRIAAWRPRIGDADERTIPHELDWLRSAVHLAKGCYRGQETVAKVHNLGHPPRRVVMLHLDGSDGVLPARGSEVLLASQPEGADPERAVIGAVTASAMHHDLGPIALAMLKRTVDPTAPLMVRPADDAAMLIPAAQELIVPPDAGAEANVPRLPRLGAVTR